MVFVATKETRTMLVILGLAVVDRSESHFMVKRDIQFISDASVISFHIATEDAFVAEIKDVGSSTI